jgi:hypothetical protein
MGLLIRCAIVCSWIRFRGDFTALGSTYQEHHEPAYKVRHRLLLVKMSTDVEPWMGD